MGRPFVPDRTTTAIAYLNNGGGRVPLLTEVVKEIWLLFVDRGWVLEPAVHVAGVDNVHANFLSRVFASCDWMLNPREFTKLDALWGPYKHDRCPSRLNHQNHLPFDYLYYEPGQQALIRLPNGGVPRTIGLMGTLVKFRGCWLCVATRVHVQHS